MGGAAEQQEDSSPRTDWLFSEMFKYCEKKNKKQALKSSRSPLKKNWTLMLLRMTRRTDSGATAAQQRLLKRPTAASQHSASPDGDQRP